MEIQFTPWRMHYIGGQNERRPGCVFCNIHRDPPERDEQNLLLLRGEHCFVVLNLFPYNTAHLMVVPYLHSAELASLPSAVAAELFELTRQSTAIVQAEYRPQGMNLGMNLGKTAGAGIAEHLHMHLVPRWEGDSNFMPIIGGTKLIPESLAQTYARLRPAFAQRGASPQAYDEA